jgi:hypothetical protein
MSVCVVIQSSGIVSTGSDVTPGAANWTNITNYRGSGTTNSQTITGLDTPVTFRASWTTSGDTNIGYWTKNGVAEAAGVSPRDVVINNNTTLTFTVETLATPASTSGTVTVTNLSDGGASIDTFTYLVEDMGSQ